MEDDMFQIVSLVQRRVHAVFVLLLLAATMLLCSCATARFTAERPTPQAFRTEIRRESSTIFVPVEVEVAEIAAVLNRSIRGELYRGSANAIGLSAVLARNGGMTVEAADNYLFVSLPLRMTLSYGPWKAPDMPFTLKFKASASITPDWRLHSEVLYQGLTDLFSDDVKLGPFSFKPRKIVDGITLPLQKAISDRIAQKLNEMLPLREHVSAAWSMAHKPILLDRQYSAWLKLSPTDVVHYPFYAQAGVVRIGVGINTVAELVIGPEPSAGVVVPLPDLKRVDRLDKTFRLSLYSDLHYRELRQVAERVLLNRPISSDGKTITIRDIELYGNGDRLVIRLHSEGALDGVFYLTARPAFDAATGIFSLEDVDFDMQSRSMLMQSGDWLLHWVLKGIVQEKLNLNLAAQLEKARQMAEKSLSRLRLMDNVYLQGDIKSLKVNDMLVQQDKVSILVYTEGESAIIFR